MDYKSLIETYKTGKAPACMTAEHIAVLSPMPLSEASELEQVVGARFRYTGPGKWLKIIKKKDIPAKSSE